MQQPLSVDRQLPDVTKDVKQKLEAANDRGLQSYWTWLQISEDCVLKRARAIVIHNHIREWADVWFCIARSGIAGGSGRFVVGSVVAADNGENHRGHAK